MVHVQQNQATATIKNLRVSPQKLNLVAGLIRGKHVSEAVTQLEFSNKRIAQDVKKLLNSAIANAENNQGLDIDSLFVKEAWVNKAMVMKRFHARARGRGARIEKPFSHMTIIVEDRSAA
jgi:large subunit ribosomal protein L22